MNYKMWYYGQANMICIVMLVLLLIVQYRQSRVNTMETHFLKKLVGLTVVYCLLDILGWICNGATFWQAANIESFLDTVYFALPTLICFVWMDYICYRMDKPNFMHTKRGLVRVIPLALTCLVTLTTPVTKYAFFIDEAGVYHRRIGAYLTPVVCMIYLGLCTLWLSQHVKVEEHKIKKDELLPLMYFPIPFFICSVLQLCYYGAALNQIGLTISIILLYFNIQFNQISIDELTGLNNRRELKQYLHTVFHASGTESIFLCMIDIDFFKTINDTYGHLEGDEALKTVAVLLKKTCSRQKQRIFLARYGGDEFIISGVNYTEQELQDFTDQVRKVADEYNQSSGKPYQITLSIGYAIGTPAEISSVQNLLKKADDRMYDVKKRRKK